MLTETSYFCMKEYSALHNFFSTINYTSQATKWNHFEVSTHVPTCNEFRMQKVALVTFIRFLEIHNFIIYNPNSKNLVTMLKDHLYIIIWVVLRKGVPWGVTDTDRVRDCITHLLSIKSLNVDDFHVSVAINI